MAKFVLKYLTKASTDALSFINKFNKTIDKDYLDEYLDKENNFILMMDAFKKITAVIFFENDESKHLLRINSLYMDEYSYFGEYVKYLTYKFVGYKIYLDKSYRDPKFIAALKKCGGKQTENGYTLDLYGSF